MLDRRTLLKTAAASAAVAHAGPMQAATNTPNPLPGAGLPASMADLGPQRLPSLHAEGMLDFAKGIERFNFTVHAPAADAVADARLTEAGLSPAAPVRTEQAIDLLAQDPVIATRWKSYLDSQRLKMKIVSDLMAPHRDRYIARMDAAAARGPGTVRLDPGFTVPVYARHELHMQPGGYVGDPLSGWVYQYAIVGLSPDHDYRNAVHTRLAAAVPTPADGKVLRILDMGAGIGQFATALRERFPQAEVWGVDASAPMLRYAHYRAVQLGVPVHLVQASAEQTAFPDAHFDMIVASGLFHEIAPEASRRIIHEAGRLLRAGGIFYPLDLYTAAGPKDDAKARMAVWVSVRWYHEDWREGYAGIDFPAEIRKAGMTVHPPGTQIEGKTVANLTAIRNA